jgi:hypothetical protein
LEENCFDRTGNGEEMSDEVRSRVYELIDAERDRQDKKWGASRCLPASLWMNILTEEVGETAETVLKNLPEENLKELVQVAAVAVAWLEGILANNIATNGDLTDICPNCGERIMK